MGGAVPDGTRGTVIRDDARRRHAARAHLPGRHHRHAQPGHEPRCASALGRCCSSPRPAAPAAGAPRVDPRRARRAELDFWRRNPQYLNDGKREWVYVDFAGIERRLVRGQAAARHGLRPRGSLSWATQAARRVGVDPLADELRERARRRRDRDGVRERRGRAVAVRATARSTGSAASTRSTTSTTRRRRSASSPACSFPAGLLVLVTDVGHRARVTEPQTFGWEVLDLFRGRLHGGARRSAWRPTAARTRRCSPRCRTRPTARARWRRCSSGDERACAGDRVGRRGRDARSPLGGRGQAAGARRSDVGRGERAARARSPTSCPSPSGPRSSPAARPGRTAATTGARCGRARTTGCALRCACRVRRSGSSRARPSAGAAHRGCCSSTSRIHRCCARTGSRRWRAGASAAARGRSRWPEPLLAELTERHGPYAPNLNREVSEKPRLARGQLRTLERMVEKRTDLLLDAASRAEWDLGVAVYYESHFAGHAFHQYAARSDYPVDVPRRPALEDGLLRVYAAQDRALARILDAVPPDTNVVVFSGMGMRPNSNGEGRCCRACSRGWAGMRRDPCRRRRGGASWPGASRSPWCRGRSRGRSADGCRPGTPSTSSPPGSGSSRPTGRARARGPRPSTVRRRSGSTSAACSPRGPSIPGGVRVGARRARARPDAARGRRHRAAGDRRDRAPRGRRARAAQRGASRPRRQVELGRRAAAGAHPRIDGVIEEDRENWQVSEHDDDGFVVMSGPAVPAGATADGRVEDIAPTVLQLLGVPAPADVDGRVLGAGHRSVTGTQRASRSVNGMTTTEERPDLGAAIGAIAVHAPSERNPKLAGVPRRRQRRHAAQGVVVRAADHRGPAPDVRPLLDPRPEGDEHRAAAAAAPEPPQRRPGRRDRPRLHAEGRRGGRGRGRAPPRHRHVDPPHRPRGLQPVPRGAQARHLLADVYEEPARSIIASETLHAIIGHRRRGDPLTLEAGDRARGRRARHGAGPLARPVRGEPPEHPLALGGGDRRRPDRRRARTARSGSRSR